MDPTLIWDRTAWDEQYRTGAWDYLANVGEMARYALIAGHVHCLVPTGRLLDVGCGEGLLYDRLSNRDQLEYNGIDFSPVAVAKGIQRHPGLRLFAAAAEEFVDPSAAPFQAIIFNEVLYAFTDPGSVLQRYRAMLAPEGKVIISTFLPEPDQQAWTAQMLRVWDAVSRQAWLCLDLVDVRNARTKMSWRVAVFQPDLK